MADRYVNWPSPTEALMPLIKDMARISVQTAHYMGIESDMDDPAVARAVIKATFDGLLLSPPRPRMGKAGSVRNSRIDRGDSPEDCRREIET